MAFHYQHLLQEKDLSYPEFEKNYPLIKEYARKTITRVKTNNPNMTTKRLMTTAITVSQNPYFYLDQNTKLKPSRVERILFITNVLFPDNEQFVKMLLHTFHVSKESCLHLKTDLNWLNRKDGDFLDGTMDALANYHIPSFPSIMQQYGLYKNDEFIIWKLMEILYVEPELFEKQPQKKKV